MLKASAHLQYDIPSQYYEYWKIAPRVADMILDCIVLLQYKTSIYSVILIKKWMLN